MAEHPATGLHVLPGPESLEDVSRIEPEPLRRVITLLGESFDHTVIDTSKSFHVCDMVAMERADLILLVVQSDLINLYNSARLLGLFRRLDGLDERVRVILNRAGSDAGTISLKKVSDTLGKPVLCQIPNSYRAFHAARTYGSPLDRRGGGKRVRSALEELTRLVRRELDPHAVGRPASEAASRRSRLWSNLVGNRGNGSLQPAGA
jgi:pilus assembly protein CpaE